MAALPLAIDLDGTLVHSDLLFESLIRLLRKNPLYCLLLPFWLLRGRAFLKAQIAARAEVAVGSLPYNATLLEYLTEQRAQGRSLTLATASQRRYAQAIADHLGVFDHVIASDSTNMKARNKADALVALYGEGGYAYAGNDSADLSVWRHAGASLVVSADPALLQRAGELAPLEWTQEPARANASTYLRACRLHQWLKNLLIFVPLFTSQKFMDVALLMQAFGAFIAFGLCASSVYLLNDLLDLDADRQHRSKCRRPFASGELPIVHGLLMIPLLLLGAISLLPFLPPDFALMLLVYYVATNLYSFGLKRIAVVDVLLLAGLYTCRIVAGGLATGVPISEWLLMFSLFLFLSLAILKRFTELADLRERGITTTMPGRGYSAKDIDVLGPLGTGSGYLSVLVFALYLSSDEIQSVYSHALMLWSVCPLLLYWISRAWILAHRGEMDDDPIMFAARDPVSRWIAVLVAALFMLAVL